jgi:hypothetical protein
VHGAGEAVARSIAIVTPVGVVNVGVKIVVGPPTLNAGAVPQFNVIVPERGVGVDEVDSAVQADVIVPVLAGTIIDGVDCVITA